ncbi:MAG TPA: putative Ig domain-containing protein, partial [Flavisolibacter sp.]|nr:putative Ig domain-containing protein [Flavisolibacter sp.]
MLPKGLALNKANGEISGTPSDTLLPTKYVVTATGPGGLGRDTITLSVGTVAFNYGTNGTFVFEKGSTELNGTAISPLVLAGTFRQFFVSPSPDSLTLKTGLKFNAQSGQISGTPTILTSTTEVPTPATFTITGISTSNKAASTTISITVNDKRPDFGYTYNGSFSVGTSVSSLLTPSVKTTSGAILKYRLAPNSPTLPAGLTLDSLSGKISGTPTASNNTPIIIRGLNSGGYQDVTVPLTIDATAATPQVYYHLSFKSGSLVDTISTRVVSGNTIYLTKNDGIGQLSIYMNPVVSAGQVSSYAVSPAFVSGISNEALSLDNNAGIVSGTPGKFTTDSTPTHTITINNAATGGTTGSYTMKIVANTPFFTYNADGGKGVYVQNIYGFVQGQPVDVANGTFPGYTAAGLKPVGGTGVVSYAIYPVSSSAPAFNTTGLSFNTTTGAISGTATTNTYGFSTYSFWDYAIVGRKADGSFTVYKIRLKIYRTAGDWG